MANTDPAQWGPALYSYLEAHWRAAGTNANAWAGSHPGVEGPTLSRWKSGDATPTLPRMVTIADALGVPLLDVLIGAGIVDRRDVGRDAARPAAPSIDAAIEHDPGLTALQRRTLRDMLAAMREVGSEPRVSRRRPGR